MILCPVVACADGLGGGFVDGGALFEGNEELYGYFIADVTNLVLVSMELVGCTCT